MFSILFLLPQSASPGSRTIKVSQRQTLPNYTYQFDTSQWSKRIFGWTQLSYIGGNPSGKLPPKPPPENKKGPLR
jgi:hypothetical protein